MASELQLIDNLSPIKYLKKQNFQSHHQLYLVWSPVLGPVDPGPVLGDDHDQEVAVLAVRGKHRPLLADLAPVAARAGLGEGGEVDAVGVTAAPLKIYLV